jgi:carbon storage regulator
MLVLSRKRGEQIAIGKDIVITIVEIRGDKTRVGIDAPKEVSVDRIEVARAKEREAAQERPSADNEGGAE